MFYVQSTSAVISGQLFYEFRKSENGLQMLSQFQVMCSVKSQTVYTEYTHKAVQTTLTNKATHLTRLSQLTRLPEPTRLKQH